MLTTAPTAEAIFDTITAEIRQQLDAESLPVPDMTMKDELNAHLGLSSLALAQLVVTLEMRFGADPFSALVPITEVRTLGDLCKAYEKILAQGDSPAGPEPTQASAALMAAQQRAAGRRRR